MSILSSIRWKEYKGEKNMLHPCVTGCTVECPRKCQYFETNYIRKYKRLASYPYGASALKISSLYEEFKTIVLKILEE